MTALLCTTCSTLTISENIERTATQWTCRLQIGCDFACRGRMGIVMRSDRIDTMDEKICIARIQLTADWNRRVREESTE